MSGQVTKRRARWKVIALGLAGLLVSTIGGLAVAIHALHDRTFDAPEPELAASDDPAMIERGRYLAYGPAHCASCHAPGDLATAALRATTADDYRRLVRVLEGVPLSGGLSYPAEIGTLHFPNITPDPETGIGRYTDGQVARLLRHGVKPNGQAQFPIMEYQNISDEDVVALLSFLRSQPPVRNPVPDHELTFMGKAVKAFLIRPIGPQSTPPATSPPEAATVERGEYLANRVAQCASCHTKRNLLTLEFTGPRLAGGLEIEEPWAPDLVFAPPNLTPDPDTGYIASWTEEQFVARFRAGTLVLGTPMDWELFGRMSDADLRAIYRYLMALDPVENETGPPVRPKGG